MEQEHNFETDAIRAQLARTEFREHSVPLYLTSSFVFEDAEQARALFADEIPGNIYTRFSNPNNTEFIQKLCLLEGTEDGIATASGMAAMYCSMAALLKSGDHVLASRSLFGSTHQILNVLFPRFGISLEERRSCVGIPFVIWFNPSNFERTVSPFRNFAYLR